MNNIETQKGIAEDILDRLELLDPYCILAGGAPRDWFLGKEANDLDFYVNLLPMRNEEEEATLNRLLGLVVSRLADTSRKESEYNCMKHLKRIYEFKYKGQDCQIMVMDTPTFKSVIDHFGTSICKVWFKRGRIHPTLDFLMSLRLKCIYKQNNYNAKEKHVSKMVERFPNYRLFEYSQLKKDMDLMSRKLNVYPTEDRLLEKLIKEFSNG